MPKWVTDKQQDRFLNGSQVQGHDEDRVIHPPAEMGQALQ